MSLRDSLFNRNRQTAAALRPGSPQGQDTAAPGPFALAPTNEMQEWNVWTQGPIGVKGDPADPDTSQKDWNAAFRSQFGKGWFGGLYPEHGIGLGALFGNSDYSPAIRDSSISFHRMWSSAYMNQAQYLRHGGSAPLGMGALQVQQFKEAADHTKPNSGFGIGGAYANPHFSPFFGAVET